MATGSGYIYKTLPNNLRIKSKAQVLAKLEGENFLRLLGDTTSVVGSRNLEEAEVYSNETPDKDLALVDVTTNDMNVNFAFRQVTPFLKRVMFQSDEEIVEQAAVQDQTVVVVGVSNGDIVDLGYVNVSGLSVAVTGNGGTVIDPSAYQADLEFGRVQLNGLAIGQTNLTMTFDAAASKTSTFGISSKTDLRARIVIRQNNKWGPSFEFEFWSMQLRVDGDMPMSADGDEFGDITVVGRAYADSTKPAAYRIGRVRELPRLAA